MPLMSVETLAPGVRLGLWRLTESADDFRLPQRDVILAHYKGASRRLEKLATYALLAAMTGEDHHIIAHEPSGKPVLEGFHLSISHTRGYVALILARDRRVAVDVEHVANRVNRIAPKFIRPDETANDTISRLLCWSAKETAYKYFSEQQLTFFEMRTQPFARADEGMLTVENLRNTALLPIHFRTNRSYVLTYAFP